MGEFPQQPNSIVEPLKYRYDRSTSSWVVGVTVMVPRLKSQSVAMIKKTGGQVGCAARAGAQDWEVVDMLLGLLKWVWKWRFV
jgi:hypothetical protein